MANRKRFIRNTNIITDQITAKNNVGIIEKKQEELNYFKVGFLCEASFKTLDGDWEEKEVQFERVFGVNKDFNWKSIEKYLNQYGRKAETLLKNAKDNTSYAVKLYYDKTEKIAGADVLNEHNLPAQIQTFAGDFCHLFNRTYSIYTTRTLHTLPLSIGKEPTPEQ